MSSDGFSANSYFRSGCILTLKIPCLSSSSVAVCLQGMASPAAEADLYCLRLLSSYQQLIFQGVSAAAATAKQEGVYFDSYHSY